MSSPCAPLSGSIRKEPEACPQCGSGSRVKRGLCLSCLLSQGLPEQTPAEISQNGGGHNAETLEDVLGEIDVRDADWRLGNYQILEEIGRGGMGVIYRARQRHSRRIVAVKRILSYLRGGFLRKALGEQTAQAKSVFNARSRAALRTGDWFFLDTP